MLFLKKAPPFKAQLTVTSVFALFLVWYFINGMSYENFQRISQPVDDSILEFHIKKQIVDTDFYLSLYRHAVSAPSLLGKYDKSKAPKVYSLSDQILTKEFLEFCVPVPKSTQDQLRESHKQYVDYLTSEDNIVDAYALVTKGTYLWDTYKDSYGIVMTGGGKYSWLSFLSIMQLRTTHSRLPVEVFIPSLEEYEDSFCEEILPKYNARCVVFKKPNPGFSVKGYQLKIFALLYSSFENTLFLDSDVFPLVNIDYLFHSDLYEENGLLLWPDAWARTTSPKYYDIAGINVLEKKVRYSESEKDKLDEGKNVKDLGDGDFSNSDFHDFENTLSNPTVEAGVIFVNKTSHLRTLQLALYYNVLGPDFYYPLLTQGAAGEGDKETFLAAANVMGEPFHVCSKKFSWIVPPDAPVREDGANGLGIHDPILSEEKPEEDHFTFLHTSNPKYFPDWISSRMKNGDSQARLYERLYTNLGYDVDLRLTKIIAENFCKEYKPEGEEDSYKNDKWAGEFMSYIRDQCEDLIDVCKNTILPHLKFLQETTKYPNTNA